MIPDCFTSCRLVVIILCVMLGSWYEARGQEQVDLESLRRSVLSDLFVLRDYRAGKNSFVESPERHPGAWTHVGYRHTLLDVKGTGSVRHIWTTRGEGQPYFDWEFYIDGELIPTLKATDVDLIRAAEKVSVPLAPANSVPLGNRDFNFFLPVPFEKSIRVEVVQRVPRFWLWFCQIDYRLEDDSMKGVRLATSGNGDELALHYVGLGQQRLRGAWSDPPVTRTLLPQTRIPAGKTVSLGRFNGPAIIRELRMNWSPDSTLELRVKYDGADSYAVRSPIAEFFGPFKGVSYYRHEDRDASSYLPMPFRRECEVFIHNFGDREGEAGGNVALESVPGFAPSWGYFHALHQRSSKTVGHQPHPVLYVQGRGHWLGMTLYKTGHDHGGGDFAVIDGEGDHPAFLHGVNGEDYFTFAWFGKGAHHPYAVAHSNDEGRYRHHFENVYPFRESIAIDWGAFADLSPESVAVWYQDSPEDTTLPQGARERSVTWDVFGPVPIEAGEEFFAGLPTVADLDAGKQFECRLLEEHFLSGWQKERSVGPMLNLTYIGRHGTPIAYEAELGGAGHAMMARRIIESGQDQAVQCHFAHDDPIEVWVNGDRVYSKSEPGNGFETTQFEVPLNRGRNEVVIRLTNYFNRTFNWAGFWMRLPAWDAR